eukprot:TRINITY_DN5728_c1_g1_i1.p1 TRINITY_DN5728_c1_g1~~TRINITY_DN5728_c1_g1_i1.p1  ORF type:complete len:635 (+),score=122.16 TRINITY_DN5728_c1_g1_i1:57-1907(+)
MEQANGSSPLRVPQAAAGQGKEGQLSATAPLSTVPLITPVVAQPGPVIPTITTTITSPHHTSSPGLASPKWLASSKSSHLPSTSPTPSTTTQPLSYTALAQLLATTQAQLESAHQRIAQLEKENTHLLFRVAENDRRSTRLKSIVAKLYENAQDTHYKRVQQWKSGDQLVSLSDLRQFQKHIRTANDNDEKMTNSDNINTNTNSNSSSSELITDTTTADLAVIVNGELGVGGKDEGYDAFTTLHGDIVSDVSNPLHVSTDSCVRDPAMHGTGKQRPTTMSASSAGAIPVGYRTKEEYRAEVANRRKSLEPLRLDLVKRSSNTSSDSFIPLPSISEDGEDGVGVGVEAVAEAGVRARERPCSESLAERPVGTNQEEACWFDERTARGDIDDRRVDERDQIQRNAPLPMSESEMEAWIGGECSTDGSSDTLSPYNPIDETEPAVPLTHNAGSFVVELTHPTASFFLTEHDCKYSIADNEYWFKEYFLPNSHETVAASESPVGPIVLSILKEPNPLGIDTEDINYRVIMRTAEGIKRTIVPSVAIEQKHVISSIIRFITPAFIQAQFMRAKLAALPNILARYEELTTAHQFKFGVLYCKNGQTTESQMLSNSTKTVLHT